MGTRLSVVAIVAEDNVWCCCCGGLTFDSFVTTGVTNAQEVKGWDNKNKPKRQAILVVFLLGCCASAVIIARFVGNTNSKSKLEFCFSSPNLDCFCLGYSKDCGIFLYFLRDHRSSGGHCGQQRQKAKEFPSLGGWIAFFAMASMEFFLESEKKKTL